VGRRTDAGKQISTKRKPWKGRGGSRRMYLENRKRKEERKGKKRRKGGAKRKVHGESSILVAYLRGNEGCWGVTGGGVHDVGKSRRRGTEI